MWGSFNSHFNNVRSQISKVAQDVIEQAEELAAPPPPGQAQPDGISRGKSRSSGSHAHRDESPVAHHRTEVVYSGGTDSHLSALKARLQAEKSRTQGQHAGISKFLQPGSDGDAATLHARRTSDGASAAVSSRHTTDDSSEQPLPISSIGQPLMAFGNGHTTDSATRAPLQQPSSQTSTALSAGQSDTQAMEVAKLKAAVKHLKEEIVHITQSNEEEVERLEAAHKMELGAVTADLEGSRRHAAALKRRVEEAQRAMAEAEAETKSSDEVVAALREEIATLRETSGARQVDLERAEKAEAECGRFQEELKAVLGRLEAMEGELKAERSAKEAAEQALSSAADRKNVEERAAAAEVDLGAALDRLSAMESRLEAESRARQAAEEALARMKDGGTAAQELAMGAEAELRTAVIRVEALEKELEAERRSTQAAQHECTQANEAAAAAAEQRDEARTKGAELQWKVEEKSGQLEELRGKLREKSCQLEEKCGQLEEAHTHNQELSQVAALASQRESELRTRLAEVSAAASEAELQWVSERRALEEAHSAAMQQAKAAGEALAAAEASSEESMGQGKQEIERQRQEIGALEQRLLALQAERERMLASQADAESTHRSEMGAAREGIGALEATVEQLRAELQAAVGKAGAGRAMMEDLAQVRADNAELRRGVEGLRVALAEMEAEKEATAERLRASEAAWTEHESAQATRLEELTNEVAGLQAALGAATRRAESAERRAASAVETADEAGPGVVAGDQGATAQLAEVAGQRDAAVAEKDRALRMLNMLKRQIADSEMEEEEKLAWRVDAEVRLALEQYKASEAAAATPSSSANLTALTAEVEAEREARRRLEAEAVEWAATVDAKDAELANLQLALGELSYESEAGDKLRHDLRVAQAEVERLRGVAAQAEAAASSAIAEADAAKAAATAAGEEAEEQRRAHARLMEGAAVLRRALEESTRRMAQLSSESSALIDRRVVVQLLVSYFERNYADEVLSVMVRMLGFTDEERSRIAASRRGGVLSRVASVPFSVLGALVPSGSGSGQPAVASQGDLAEAWVEFLIKQAEGRSAEETGLWSEETGTRPPASSVDPGTQNSLSGHVQEDSKAGDGSAVGLPEFNPSESRLPCNYPATPHANGDNSGTGGEVWQPRPMAQRDGIGGGVEGEFTVMSLESPTKPLPPWRAK